MPDISFSSFNNRSFEQFTQALAASILGAGIMIFGDGPDGGREAAFDGTVPYPNSKAPWSGYTVMQAKFRQAPAQSGADADWLVAQLAADMAGFDGNARRAPDYYILVTNVRLSGVQGRARKGGLQKIDEAFEKHCKPLGIKELHVWHAERIATLLDLAPDLFRSYEAWLSPREVLSAAFRFFEAQSPNFGMVMSRYLQREFRNQRETRLQQAGHVSDGGTKLEDVFVDLPCDGDALPLDAGNELSPHVSRTPHQEPLVLDVLLSRLALKLDPLTLSTTWPRETLGAPPSRHLLLGGPGQGKSTISQFLGQIARWRLLAVEDPSTLSPDLVAALNSFGTRAAALDVPVDGVRRYPVRVDLPTFADAIEKAHRVGSKLSLLSYITTHIGQLADADVAIEDVRRWLATYPWLVLLDGLDEVPPSGNRTATLQAITEFWDEATPLRADVAVVVTTRPQGYNDDLDPHQYLKLELTRLNSERALQYAEKLALLRLEDSERRARVLERLASAAESPATQALMVSPLQVAILFQLVDQRGQAPSDRWSLFDEYLGIFIKREQEKPGPAGETMRTRARNVQTLVRRAGILLHSVAEGHGAAAAHLTSSQLSELVCDLLIEDEFTPEEAQEIANDIVVATTDRLAFLEQREEGRYSFEVRSLQEYAAAAALMSGREAEVMERLRQIAGHSHWAHVYRIAASKAFSDPDAEIFRDTILVINRQLDDTDPAARTICLGAATSLALFEDGLATDQPRYRRLFAKHALDTLRLGAETLKPSFAEQLPRLGKEFVAAELGARLGSSNKQERTGSWSLLLAMTQYCDWAGDLVVQLWPQDPDITLDALTSVALEVPEPARSKIAEAIGNACPAKLRKQLQWRDQSTGYSIGAQLAQHQPMIRPVSRHSLPDATRVGFLSASSPMMKFNLNTFDAASAIPWWSTAPSEQWAIAAAVAPFMAEPSTASLAEFAAMMTDDKLLRQALNISLAWPLGTLALQIEEGDDPIRLAQDVAEGGYGTLADWMDSEKRLKQEGLREADLTIWSSGKFFDKNIAEVGAPYFTTITRSHDPSPKNWAAPILTAARQAAAGPALTMLRFALAVAIEDNGIEWLEPSDLAIAYPLDGRRHLGPEVLRHCRSVTLQDATLLAHIDAMSCGQKLKISDEREIGEVDKALFRLAEDGKNPGLLRVAVSIAAAQPTTFSDIAPRLEAVASTFAAGSNTPVQRSAATLLLASGAMSVEDAVAIVFDDDVEAMEQHALVALASTTVISRPDSEKVLAAAAERLDVAAPGLRHSALTELRRNVDARKSNLSSPETWSALGLPRSLMLRVQALAA